jgi:hypothetical protein
MNAPWYRHPWPWFIISGPALVIVAGAITTWIAFASADGLVADDYYKQGMAINKMLARENAAIRLGVAPQVDLREDRITVRLNGQRPQALFVHLAHATRAGEDLRLRLVPTGDGVYEAPLGRLAPGRWRIIVEDPQATWRHVESALQRGL